MAQDLTQVIPQLLAQGLMALRTAAVMPMSVNRDYEEDAKKKGSQIDVTIPSDATTEEVAPAITPQAAGTVAPTMVSVELSQWRKSDFSLTDKDLQQVVAGTIPQSASSASVGMTSGK